MGNGRAGETLRVGSRRDGEESRTSLLFGARASHDIRPARSYEVVQLWRTSRLYFAERESERAGERGREMIRGARGQRAQPPRKIRGKIARAESA